jgi:ABC-type sugar transport system ATPase subunit
MIVVTHDQAEAMALAEKLVVFDKGRVQQVGLPADVYDGPRNLFVAGFIGDVPMNLLSGEVREAAGGGYVFVTWQWEVRLKREMPRGEMVMGVRPEAVRLEPARAEGGNAGVVTHVEVAGDRRLVTLQLEGHSLEVVAKTDRWSEIGIGARMVWQANEADLHWFNVETGKRIGA